MRAGLAIGLVAVGMGLSIAMLAPEQGVIVVLAALLVLLIGIVSMSGRRDIDLFVGFVLVASSFVDLPRDIAFGPATALALLGMIYTLLAIVIRVVHGSPSPQASAVLRPFWFFLLWGFVSLVSHPQYFLSGFQNLIVVLCFTTTAAAVATAGRSENISDDTQRLLVGGSIGVTLLYLASVAVGGFGTELVVTARSYALFVLLGFAGVLARWRYGARGSIFASALLFLGLFTSLSRLAIGAAIILLAMTWLKTDSLLGILRAFVLLGISLFLVVNAVNNVQSLRERFFEGDLYDVGGGISVNVSGRANFWGAIWESFLESPFVGQGAGSAGSVVSERFEEVTHPHNDYLRVLHDYGLIGMAFFGWGMIRLLLVTRRASVVAESLGDRRSARAHYLAFLALLAMMLSMITDNSISYVFLMAPLGVLVGASLGRLAPSVSRLPARAVGMR